VRVGIMIKSGVPELFTTRIGSEMIFNNRMWKTIVCIGFYLVWGQFSYAEKPGIDINLKIISQKNQSFRNCPSKIRYYPYFNHDDNIIVKIIVKNSSNDNLMVSSSFPFRDFHRDIRLIDPTGKIVLPKHRSSIPHISGPHAPPLGYIKHGEEFVRVAPCKLLPTGWTLPASRSIKNLNAIYDLSLPGIYSVQVQVSLMQFKKDYCSVEDFTWQGLLTSSTEYFFYAGDTKANIYLRKVETPNKDKTKSKILSKCALVAEVLYTREMVKFGINKSSVRINGIKPTSYYYKSHSFTVSLEITDKIINKFKTIKGFSYPITISGYLNDGRKFGAADMICIPKDTICPSKN